MATKHQLESNADNILNNAENANEPKEQFDIVYKGTVKPILLLIKSFTGPKIDEQMDKFIYAADGVCSDNNPDVRNYCHVWNSLNLKLLLKGIQIFTGPKVDKVLNKFIEISDSLCV